MSDYRINPILRRCLLIIVVLFFASVCMIPVAADEPITCENHVGWIGTDTLPTSAGKYYLTANVEISETWSVPTGETILCLNGYTVRLVAERGNVVNVPFGTNLTIYDCSGTKSGKITGGKGVIINKYNPIYESVHYGGGVFVSGGNFTMNGGVIAGNTVEEDVGELLMGPVCYFGGGVCVTNGGTFIMNSGTIRDNTVSYRMEENPGWGEFVFGGGVCVRHGTFTMNGGTISGNTAADFGIGGGVYVVGLYDGIEVADSTFTMNGGTISGNTAADLGGGVYVCDGTFIMSAGTIAGNTANDGSGIYIETKHKDSTFTMNGGTVTGNTATGDGGGIYIYGYGHEGSTFTMNGGTVTGNIATGDGGGLYLYLIDSTFTMNGGTISGNTANNGGGVNSEHYRFIMNGGTISDNMAVNFGGGVYGNPIVTDGTITGNAAAEGGGVYLKNSYATYSTFIVSGDTKIIGNFIKDTETANNVDTSKKPLITIGNAGLGDDAMIGVTTKDAPPLGGLMIAIRASAGDEDKFVSDGGEYPTDFDAVYNQVILQSPKPAVTHECENHALTEWYAWETTDEAPVRSGNYYLVEDIELPTSWVVPVSGESQTWGHAEYGNTVLCLNGHNLSLNDGMSLPVIGTFYSNLTLYDCQGIGAITGGTAGVIIQHGIFTMKSGTISNNTGHYGGGVILSLGYFNMDGGTISNNTGEYGGGVYVDDGAIFTMNGGTISNNNGECGGVYVNHDFFIMNSGTISDNTGEYGGVYLDNSEYGGGGYLFMTGGEIINNTATKNGGGVYVTNSRYFTISGAPKIIDNKKGIDQNNVFLGYGSVIDIRNTDEDELADMARIGVTVQTPEDGLTIAENAILGDGDKIVSDSIAYTTEFDLVNRNIILKTSTTVPTTHPIIISTDGNGEASASPASATPGTTVTVTATPNENYIFKEWQVLSGDIDIAADNTFTMPDSAVNIKAVFEPISPDGGTTTELSVTAEKSRYFLGEPINLRGISPESGDLYIYVAGSRDPCTKLDTTITTTAETPWSTTIDTLSSHPQFLDEGDYTIYVSKVQDAESIDDLGTFASVTVTLRHPVFTVTDSPAFMVYGSSGSITGTAEATEEIQVYIFATNFFAEGKTTIQGYTGNMGTVTVEENAFTVNLDILQTLPMGQYYVVLQHPMDDGKFNVKPVGTVITLEDSEGNSRPLFDVSDRQELKAAEALCDFFDTQNIDDDYILLSFDVVLPSITLSPLAWKITKGSILTVSGQTNLGEGETVNVEMLSLSHRNEDKDQISSRHFIALTTTTDENGKWEAAINTAGLDADEYEITASIDGYDRKAVVAPITVVIPDQQPPKQPSSPSTLQGSSVWLTESPTPTPTETVTPTETATETPTEQPDQNQPEGQVVPIAGIVAGGAVVLAAAGLGAGFFLRRR